MLLSTIDNNPEGAEFGAWGMPVPIGRSEDSGSLTGILGSIGFGGMRELEATFEVGR